MSKEIVGEPRGDDALRICSVARATPVLRKPTFLNKPGLREDFLPGLNSSTADGDQLRPDNRRVRTLFEPFCREVVSVELRVQLEVAEVVSRDQVVAAHD